MPIAAWSSASRLTCVLVAGWQTSVSGPPSDVADRGDAEPVEGDPRGVDPAGELDRQLGRHHRQLTGCQVVLGVVGQAGVVDGGHPRMGQQGARRAPAPPPTGAGGERPTCAGRGVR